MIASYQGTEERETPDSSLIIYIRNGNMVEVMQSQETLDGLMLNALA